MLVDRGYGHRRGIGSALAEGGWVVGRINWHNLPLQEETKERFDLIAWLRQVSPTEASETGVWVDTPHRFFKMRLIARRLSKKATQAAQRRIRKEARKKGRTPNWRSIVAAGFVILVTNLPTGQWNTEEVLELYRIRWQVELMFKRLKGVLDLDQLRSKDSTLAQVYLLGKLLAALMSDELTGQVSLTHPEWFESTDRPLSPWRMLVVLTDWMRDAVRGVITLERIMASLGNLGRYLRDAPRKRPQQCAHARALLLALNSG